jgi:hypothetical protein
MENYDVLFNPQTEVKDSKSSVNAEEFSPSADKGLNGIYKAVIRFIPYWQDPTHGSIKEKWTCWLIDPITQRGKYVDCPSSVGKPSLLQDMYWKLKKSDNVAMQKKAEVFSRRHSYASLIQVIKDDQNKDNEGKIMVWRYGIKIWEKINAELKPMIGDKHDPFDILNGKPFALVITKVSGFNNYDQSKFIDQKLPLCIPTDGKLIPITKDTDKKMVFEFVKANSPDLSKYSYKEWDAETNNYVNHIISAITGKANVSQNYADIKNKNTEKSSSANITSTDLNLDDLSTVNTDLPDLDISDININSNSDMGNLDDVLSSL